MTYTSRLWCVFELYVFVLMQVEGEASGIEIVPIGRDEAETATILETWETFDCEVCECSGEDA